ncbi:hypothetical protein DL93DRAFT_1319085 [Clavulina sp. PMI_390]|nr:hypothetical protein DL93DRAFT_1319085 [Clavulina sp. PMI_390]
MISCEEEAQKAVCATIRPILEFVDSEYFNCHRHGFTTSEAHHICSHLAKTFANRRQADMMVILKRTQELGAFQTILALLLDIAPFVGSLSPAELEADWDNGQPSVWFSLVSSFGLMTLEILEAKKLLPSLYDEIKVHYQRSGLELINILLNSKNLFERVDGRIGKVLMDIRSQLFRFMPHRVFEDATDSLPPDLRYVRLL